MKDLLPHVRLMVRRHELLAAGATVVVGVSGGADSLCLLHLLLRLAPELALRLHVAHLNHGLRGVDADDDARFVAEQSAQWGLSCTVGQADVAAPAAMPGVSLEEAARQARYSFLAQVAHATGAETIAVGHNADDQAETVLMHFLRGSGAAGLRGMLPVTRLADLRLVATDTARLFLIRPLLAMPRADIEAYCTQHELMPRFDRSNEDTTLFRNRLRHELLPLLTTYNPAVREVLAHTAAVLAGDYELLQARLDAAWLTIAAPAPAGEVRFDLTQWREQPIAMQRGLLRAAVQRLRHNLRNINWEHVERAVWLSREGATGQQATLAAGLAVEVGYDTLRVAAEATAWPVDLPQIAGRVALAAPGVTPLGGGWHVTLRVLARGALPSDYTANNDPWSAWLDAAAVGPAPTLRPRQPGDRFRPQGLGGQTKLNEFMINVKAPRAARAGWPLLIGRSGIAWACGLRLDEHAVVTPATERIWHVQFARTPASV